MDRTIQENINYGENASVADAKRGARLAEARKSIDNRAKPVGPVYIPDSLGKSTGAGSHLILGETTNAMDNVSAALIDSVRSRAAGRHTAIVIGMTLTRSPSAMTSSFGEGRVANQAPYSEGCTRAWISPTKRTKPAHGCRLGRSERASLSFITVRLALRQHGFPVAKSHAVHADNRLSGSST